MAVKQRGKLILPERCAGLQRLSSECLDIGDSPRQPERGHPVCRLALGGQREIDACRAGCVPALGFTLTAAIALQVQANSSESGYVVAAQTHMSEPSAFINGTDDRAYYLATTFPDGWFFQAGYNDAATDYPGGTYSSYCGTGFSWFVTGILGGSHLDSLYNTGLCGMNGDQTFTLQIYSSNETDVYWQFHRGSYFIGPQLDLPVSGGNFHFLKTSTAVTTELVSNPNPPPAPFPTETYDKALRFEDSYGAHYYESSTGHFYGSSDRQDTNCEFALRVDGTDQITTGRQDVINATHCHKTGDPLW